MAVLTCYFYRINSGGKEVKYFKFGHGKWHCTKYLKNKVCFSSDGQIYCDFKGKPAIGILSNGNYWKR